MRVAVIGAGIAGLSAARELTARGHDVVVFEKSRVPGGRVATRSVAAVELPRGLSGDLAFDHGAQYFTVRDDRFSMLAAEWERDRIITRWTGRIVSFDGEGWEDLAASAEHKDVTHRYVGTPGMSAIAAALSTGLDIRFEQRIGSIAALSSDFDRVIVAVPPGEASRLVPGLPPVAMQPCWTVMAAFEERVAARFDAAFVNGSALAWIARNSSKPKRNWKIDTWVMHASTAWSAAHLDDRSDDVGAFLMEAFEDLIAAGLPKAFYAAVHRWRHATADPPLAVGTIRYGDVVVCGDWCKGPRIEDAYLSGLDAASE
ncbi:MAG TPA: FAD-dependent oxidoreductase [Vicinamibacterales bacterium]|nr:FAD-dependent oxidoreductase [Vicinamibacterales bacterium]